MTTPTAHATDWHRQLRTLTTEVRLDWADYPDRPVLAVSLTGTDAADRINGRLRAWHHEQRRTAPVGRWLPPSGVPVIIAEHIDLEHLDIAGPALCLARHAALTRAAKLVLDLGGGSFEWRATWDGTDRWTFTQDMSDNGTVSAQRRPADGLLREVPADLDDDQLLNVWAQRRQLARLHSIATRRSLQREVVGELEDASIARSELEEALFDLARAGR